MSMYPQLPAWLQSLTQQNLVQRQIPLRTLLQDSLYYPSCALDGGVVKDCNERAFAQGIHSFVYADLALGAEAFLDAQNGFRHYRVLAHRPVDLLELVPDGHWPEPQNRLHRQRRLAGACFLRPFQHWTVYERLPEASAARGPQRFSLLFVGAEGLGVLQGLYQHNCLAPRALALIDPGHRFGHNWTDFWNPQEPFYQAISQGPGGPPQVIYCGGRFGDELTWPGYTEQRQVKQYFHGRQGLVRLYERSA